MSATPESMEGDVTQLLGALHHDGATGINALTCDENALTCDEAFSRVYAMLRRMAQQQRGRWRGNETLNATALVHEAYLKLSRHDGRFENHAHFLAMATKAMRQLLINYAQRCAAHKRGGGQVDLTLDEPLLVSEQRSEELLALDEALERLQTMDPRAAQVVECRVFGGLSAEETATAIGVTRRTVSRDWRAARAWLYGELRADLTRSAP